ncbi:tetratricopeptide repeat protein [Levilactobacillus bambusae]|uniref:Uncharacterized protein n=1 Tax=Levilactobacillus bambusae TaxID=2024736 RepID=A0A2V1N0V9_9LACO|nr:tetratricopeptide repeat protein [Levilactobacillus bambusae]PWG00653.1 hypothetical protein DCM90_00305 [Levilactobacillus bambusae]
MSDTHEQEDQMNQALHELVLAIDQEPTNWHHYYDLGTLLVQVKSYAQAEELFMKALGMFDQDEEAKNALIYGLGNVYYAAEEFDKAIRQFQQIKDQNLQSDAYMMLAQSYMAQGNHKQALVFALTAQAHRQQDAEANQLVADNLLALGHNQEAADFYDRVLTVDPQNGKANFDRGITAMVLGEPFEAYFKMAEQTDPQYFEAGQQRLAEIERFLQAKDGRK